MDAVRARIEYLAASAQRECLSFMPGRAQSAASLAESRPLDEAALRRGVVLRTVYQDSMRNDPGTLDYAAWLVAAGGEVRTVPVLPSRMLIVDDRVALVPIDPENSRAGAMQLTGTGVVSCLQSLFTLVWASADPLSRVPERDPGGLTAQQRELLRLLGEGLTDDAAANRLGVSQRTARRMMADLMTLLGARSRFEAGRLATRRGWL
jgi:DNA-binding CsgD family transcriptional regulator